MNDLTKNQLILIDGGNVPTAYYMDSDVIKANARAADAVFSFLRGLVEGFYD
jgi:hypothetical protein